MRRIVLVVLGAVVLLAPHLAAAGQQDSLPFVRVSHAPMLGAVPPHAGGNVVGHSQPLRPLPLGAAPSPFDGFGPTSDDNLTYGGVDQTPAGQVMDHVSIYAIYWVPPGYTTAANYQNVVDGFFTNAAAASGTAGNVFASTTQYGNPVSGAFSYGMTFAGSTVDTWPFPANGCTEPPSVLGVKKCLDDLQIEAEVKRVADAKGWPHGHNVEYFMYTPANVGSCFEGVCAYDYYCAYHSEFLDRSSQEYIYANMPWPNQKVNYGYVYPSVCDTGNHPNGSGSYPAEQSPTPLDAADEVINVTSHEASESITDPDGMEWWVDNQDSFYWGAENGDLCAWYSPGTEFLGQTPSGPFDQLIGNGQYYVQGEWSNASATTDGGSGCVWAYPAPAAPASTTAPAVPNGAAQYGSTLVALDTGSWTNSPTYFDYQWQRCDTGGANCVDIDGATANAYTIAKADVGRTLAVNVTAINAGGSATELSDRTAIVSASFPYNTSEPTITPVDTVTVGHQLNGSAGTWAGSPTRYTFVWQRCVDSLTCKTVKTFKSTQPTSTYKLGAADDKQTIVLGVIASNGVGTTGLAVLSAASDVVGGEPEGGSVDVTGTLAGGQVLQAAASGWSPAATSYVTTWQRCDTLGNFCSAIKTFKGAASTTSYTLKKADLGHTIYVQQWAKNSAGTSDVATFLTDTVASS